MIDLRTDPVAALTAVEIIELMLQLPEGGTPRRRGPHGLGVWYGYSFNLRTPQFPEFLHLSGAVYKRGGVVVLPDGYDQTYYC